MRSKPKTVPIGPGKLTTRLVAWRLGTRPAVVAKLHKDGFLPGERVDGVLLFDVDVVETYARRVVPKADRRRREARTTLEVRAFKLFDNGCCNMREAVRELRTTPDQIARLFGLWKEPDIEKHVHVQVRDRKTAALRRGRSKIRQLAELLQSKAIQEETAAKEKAKAASRTGIDQDIDNLFSDFDGVRTYGPKKGSKPS